VGRVEKPFFNIRQFQYLLLFTGDQIEGEVHDIVGNQLEDGDQRDDQSDTTELDLLAESESDSDDNQDHPSTQSRSEQTAATVGSETDDDSGESSQQEEEESEAGETDEQVRS